ncbi:hypothetical protein SAMD00019534_017580 [Acytostelium subglobosum LB1]|uniref:hypothetical protein n=1 Tax=Acytostelium subglobosum LB1 TaxID=1410327 RepID=UPI000644D496|nr:hypothetical protein SAMD00019534_017580 [Acytostelium subglobosum LB1]GAM18583.1 hypothetical protein SAMD00019534_017580 [Acytostelium subglobosum LB1]|eukprot:XP_012757803.1 hypothetical protein SAMD00019534_017580 [Acytostelium subglobosum LB1]
MDEHTDNMGDSMSTEFPQHQQQQQHEAVVMMMMDLPLIVQLKIQLYCLNDQSTNVEWRYSLNLVSSHWFFNFANNWYNGLSFTPNTVINGRRGDIRSTIDQLIDIHVVNPLYELSTYAKDVAMFETNFLKLATSDKRNHLFRNLRSLSLVPSYGRFPAQLSLANILSPVASTLTEIHLLFPEESAIDQAFYTSLLAHHQALTTLHVFLRTADDGSERYAHWLDYISKAEGLQSIGFGIKCRALVPSGRLADIILQDNLRTQLTGVSIGTLRHTDCTLVIDRELLTSLRQLPKLTRLEFGKHCDLPELCDLLNKHPTLTSFTMQVITDPNLIKSLNTTKVTKIESNELDYKSLTLALEHAMLAHDDSDNAPLPTTLKVLNMQHYFQDFGLSWTPMLKDFDGSAEGDGKEPVPHLKSLSELTLVLVSVLDKGQKMLETIDHLVKGLPALRVLNIHSMLALTYTLRSLLDEKMASWPHLDKLVLVIEDDFDYGQVYTYYQHDYNTPEVYRMPLTLTESGDDDNDNNDDEGEEEYEFDFI